MRCQDLPLKRQLHRDERVVVRAGVFQDCAGRVVRCDAGRGQCLVAIDDLPDGVCVNLASELLLASSASSPLPYATISDEESSPSATESAMNCVLWDDFFWQEILELAEAIEADAGAKEYRTDELSHRFAALPPEHRQQAWHALDVLMRELSSVAEQLRTRTLLPG